jgi:hypothetical protein
MLLNYVISTEISKMRRKLNAFKMVADISSNGIKCKNTRSQHISHLALGGLMNTSKLKKKKKKH